MNEVVKLTTRFNLGKLTSHEVLEIKSHVKDSIGILDMERNSEELVLVFDDTRYIDSMINHLKNLKKQMCANSTAEIQGSYWKTEPKRLDTSDFHKKEEEIDLGGRMIKVNG